MVFQGQKGTRRGATASKAHMMDTWLIEIHLCIESRSMLLSLPKSASGLQCMHMSKRRASWCVQPRISITPFIVAVCGTCLTASAKPNSQEIGPRGDKQAIQFALSSSTSYYANTNDRSHSWLYERTIYKSNIVSGCPVEIPSFCFSNS